MENEGFNGYNMEEDLYRKKMSPNDWVGNVDTESSAPGVGITFTWSSLCVSTVPQDGKRCCGLLSAKPKPAKLILDDVCGQARPGELLAIMGSSGAGKSTLLNTLLYRNMRGLQVSGKRIAQGRQVTSSSITGVSGYVQQQDLFVGIMTVKEHLIFQSRVRMQSSLSETVRMERVEKVIMELGLSKVANTVIGVPGRITGISGGEKKRLSLASEILTNPALLFLDEPTSGLDSFMTASVVELLVTLARQGRTIICTIHQPSSQVFSSFDQLLLLAEGRTAYIGPAREAKMYFTNQGYPCPQDYNPADHLVSVLAVTPGQEGTDRDRVLQLCDAFKQSELGVRMEEAVTIQEKEAAVETQGEDRTVSPYLASWCQQFQALVWRNRINTLKDPTIAKVTVMKSLVVALILGVVFFQQEWDQKGIQNFNGALFVLVVNMSFSNVFAVVNVFCSELPLFCREHFNGMYRTDVYFIAKQVVDIPLFFVEPMIVTTILYWMAGLNPEPEKFFVSLGIVLLTVQVVLSVGYLLSSITLNVEIALAIGPVVVIPFMLFGGLFVNAGSVPIWLDWLKHLSWILYSFEGLMINQWTGVQNITCPAVPATSQHSVPCISSGEDVLRQLSFDGSSIWFDVLMLLVLAVVLRFLAFLALWGRTRKMN